MHRLPLIPGMCIQIDTDYSLIRSYINSKVDIAKKSNKWECKVCRVKQVVKREFFRGSGAECRLKVQQLNLEHGQKQQQQNEQKILEAENEIEPPSLQTQGEKRPSKWAAFVDEPIKRITETRSGPRTTLQEHDSDGTENVSTKRTSAAYKRKAQSNYSVKENPYSKWQKFL